MPFVLFAQLWTLRPNLTCSGWLSPGVNPGLQSLIPWDRNGPRQGFFPAPRYPPTRPFALHLHPYSSPGQHS